MTATTAAAPATEPGQAEALERRIRAAGDEAMRLARAGNSKGARAFYVVMADLISQRSPETVARLERKRGLR